jgi:hypothetical protein
VLALSGVEGRAFAGHERRPIVGDKYFAGMKRAVHNTGAVGGVERGGQRSSPRDQIIDRRRPEVAECGFK